MKYDNTALTFFIVLGKDYCVANRSIWSTYLQDRLFLRQISEAQLKTPLQLYSVTWRILKISFGNLKSHLLLTLKNKIKSRELNPYTVHTKYASWCLFILLDKRFIRLFRKCCKVSLDSYQKKIALKKQKVHSTVVTNDGSLWL